MAGNRTITSPTDTPEQIQAALKSTFSQDPAEPVQKAAEATEDPAKVEAPPAEPDAAEKLAAGPEGDDPVDDGEDDEPEIEAKAAEPAAKPTRGSLKARIAELTRQRHDTARERDTAREEKAALQRQLDALMAKEPKIETKVSADEPAPKPVVTDFEKYEDFVTAMGDWATTESQRAARVEIGKARKEDADRAAAIEAKRTFDQAAVKYQERLAATKAVHDDFDEVVGNPDLPDISLPMRSAIVNSELSGDLLYFLAQNPKEIERISKLDPGPALVAMGRLEAKIESTRTTTTSEPAKKTVTTSTARSVARVPIAPVGGTAVTSTKSINEMTFQEHRAARRAGTLR